MAYSDTLVTIRDNLASIINTELAYQATNGPKPSYQANGRQVQWSEWLEIMHGRLLALDAQIAAQSEPFELPMRGY